MHLSGGAELYARLRPLSGRIGAFVQTYGDAAPSYLEAAARHWYGTPEQRGTFKRACARSHALGDACAIVEAAGLPAACALPYIVQSYLGYRNVDLLA